MLDLLDVLELIMNGFDEGALTQQELIDQRHPFVLHVFTDLGHEVQTPFPEFLEQSLADIPSITDQFPGKSLGQLWNRRAVIDMAGGDLEGEQFATIVDDPMELETVKPAHGGFAATGHWFKYLVAMDALVMAHHQGGGIHESNPGVLAPASVQVDAHRHQHRRDQCHKTGVTHNR